MEQTMNMTKGKPLKLLVLFALPLMFGNVCQQLYIVVDAAIVGRGVGVEALAALGTMDWISWLMVGFAQGFTQGFAVRVAQKFGEGNMPELKKYVGQAAVLTAVLAVVITVLGQVLLPVFLILMRVPAELQEMAVLYMRILLLGLPIVFFFNYGSAILRAVGNSSTPLKAMVVASVLNVMLDLIAVFGLGWGIAGAAGATVVAQCVAGFVCMRKIRRTPELYFGKKEMRLERLHTMDLLRVGTPIALKSMVICVGGMILQTVVNSFGMSFIAGYTATNKLCGLMEIAAVSFGYAITTYVGQNYGANQLARIKTGMRASFRLSVITACSIAAIMILFGRKITMLFIASDVPELVAAAGETAYRYLVVMSFGLPFLYFLHIYMASLQGMGFTSAALVSGGIEFFMRVVISQIAGFTGFSSGIFYAEVSAWLGSAIYLVWSYRRNVRKAELFIGE